MRAIQPKDRARITRRKLRRIKRSKTDSGEREEIQSSHFQLLKVRGILILHQKERLSTTGEYKNRL
jgi:hypothetical protein